MNKYQVVLTDGTVSNVSAAAYASKDGFVFFYGKEGSVEVAFAVATVKSFRQLPPGAA